MTQFWIAALALGLAAAALVLVPVIRAWAKQDGERSSSALGVGIVIALAIPVVSMMLYARWTTWDWSTGGSVVSAEGMHEMDEAIGTLQRRLAQQPDDIESWLLLGRSYMSMRRFGDAAQAYRQAAVVDGQNNPQILADYGEALALSDPEGLAGEAGAIFERVLSASPSNPKALWYGGLNAYENANFALADERLSRLLTMNPPETLVPLIEERIAAARAHSGEAAMTASQAPAAAAAQTSAAVPPESVAAVEPAEPAPVVAAESEAAPATETAASADAAGDGISLEVSLDPALAARIPGPTPLFIIARNPGGGAPLAVIRTTSAELPMSVTLSDANAMMAGVTISDQSELELVARVALSGSPAQRPGDLFGAVNYVRGSNSGPTRIRIDSVAE
jgi:cytochrome c-type biogenesis protein CcmH